MVLPYLKGLIIILCGFFYLALWIYCVFSICGYYIGRYIQVLNIEERLTEKCCLLRRIDSVFPDNDTKMLSHSLYFEG
jgi:hypothetical protein